MSVPFLNIGDTFASLQSLGEQPVCKDCLKIICNILAESDAVFFRKRFGIASGPTANQFKKNVNVLIFGN